MNTERILNQSVQLKITEGPDILYSERSADKDRNINNNGTEHLTIPGNYHGDEGDDILLTEEQLAAANLSRLEGEELLEKLGDTMLTPEQLAPILKGRRSTTSPDSGLMSTASLTFPIPLRMVGIA
ncbi:uncharacterized protein LOC119573584 [Penaeus monodon]|uniref:uncharacterized protein LOC119573584 n=1 Tax=Penaeus monodon TaxID=6687 RepID=UPI0018A763E2|nr:uncharacterized protein LOC119573584 [Penaeus monodon]